MAKTLTLEEAAQYLGMTVEQFKLNLQTHKEFRAIRPLMGGSTMHFREQDIEELARRLGVGSDPILKVGDGESESSLAVEEEQIEIGREPRGSSPRLQSPSSKRLPKPAPEPALEIESSDEFVPLADDPGTSKKDSDARLTRDSSVRLKGKGQPTPGTPTEEIDLEAEAKAKGESEVFRIADEGAKPKSGTKPPSSVKINVAPKADPGSEFELTLDPDSDSEFELTLSDDSGQVGGARDATGKSGKSGVRLNKPADSGISLEKKSDEDESDFELNLDSATAQKIPGGPKSSKKKTKVDSESEFELSLDESSGELGKLNLESSAGEAEKDIFATDFDIPTLEESASEAVVLDESDTALESSDFDLDESSIVEDQSASEVVQLEEDVLEDADELSAEEVDEEVEEEEAAAPVAAAGPAPWGPLPALVLFPCLFILMIVSFMGFELMHGMWSYRTGGSKPTYTITRGIAGIFGADLPKD
jgi:hypothetical protein